MDLLVSGVNSASWPVTPRKSNREACPTPSCNTKTCCPRSSTSRAANRGRNSTASVSKKALFGESQKARKYAYGIHNNIPEGRPYPIRSIRDEKYALIWNLTPEKEYHEKHLMKDPPSNTGVWEAWKSSENTDPEAKRLIDRFVNRPEFGILRRGERPVGDEQPGRQTRIPEPDQKR